MTLEFWFYGAGVLVVGWLIGTFVTGRVRYNGTHASLARLAQYHPPEAIFTTIGEPGWDAGYCYATVREQASNMRHAIVTTHGLPPHWQLARDYWGRYSPEAIDAPATT